MADRHVERAKELLRQKLDDHADEGVRVINKVAELPDDHPSVLKIAAALRLHEAGSSSHGR